MGLALHNPIDFPLLEESSTFKHFPIVHRSPHRPGQKLRVSKAKFASWTSRSKLRPYQAVAIENLTRAASQGRWGTVCYRKRIHRERETWSIDAVEARALARSAIQLPSDHNNGATRSHGRGRSRGRVSITNSRPPSLSRQGAFRDANTAKERWIATYASHDTAADVDVAELYRLGLLYDDDYERGAGFSLDTIVHSSPVFSVSVSSSKRGAKRAPASGAATSGKHDNDWNLSLDLSYADFLTDEEVARLLAGPADHELAEIYLDSADTPNVMVSAACSTTTPLTGFYHSDDDCEASDDKMSDSQRMDGLGAMFDDASESRGANDDINDEMDVSQDEDGIGDEWAFLQGDECNDDDDVDDEGSALVNSIVEEAKAASSSNPNAWIMLG